MLSANLFWRTGTPLSLVIWKSLMWMWKVCQNWVVFRIVHWEVLFSSSRSITFWEPVNCSPLMKRKSGRSCE